MPWRGPSEFRPWPSLGWAIADQLDDLFPAEPLIDEQVAKLVRWYRIDPRTGKRFYRRGQLMGPKGVGKSPEGARWSIGELVLEVVFDGWDAAGEPVARPWDKPLVQIAAVSEDQTDNTYGALLELLTANDGKVADQLGLDAGQTRILRRGQPAARIDAVTASAGSREGQRVTFALLDETHLWTPTNGGHRLAATVRRNAGKMGGTTVETTNMYDPAMDTVAQATDEAVEAGAGGVFQWKPQVGHDVPSLANRREVKRALRRVYAGAHWIDVDRLVDEMHDPDTSEADARRYYLNEKVKGANAAFDPADWAELALPKRVVPDGELIVAGFDGSRSDDSTALIGSCLSDGHTFDIGLALGLSSSVWEKPEGAGDDWEVPVLEVDRLVAAMMGRWQVGLLYADPPWWEDMVAAWQGTYGDSVVKAWWTNREKPMVWAVRRFHHAIVNAEQLTHDGSDPLRRHVGNARRRTSKIRDDKGKPMWTIGKETPGSPLKMDAAMAAVLATEARADAIASGMKPSNDQAWFI